jgi:lipoic acid synthetase
LNASTEPFDSETGTADAADTWPETDWDRGRGRDEAPAAPAGGRRERGRFPPWIRKRLPTNADAIVAELMETLHLGTVCRSARCPNRLECFQKHRATFLLMGPHCTRGCRFCAVTHEAPPPLDPAEPARVAEAAAELRLRHVVVTSVTRDDLPDGGAAHFAATVRAVRERAPRATVEILTPDFRGKGTAWAVAAESRPDVFNHNIETVPRLYARVRPGADFEASVALLGRVKRAHPELATKSGLMVGLGERPGEVLAAARALREAGVDMITVGQYLQPSPGNLPVETFVTPEAFADLERDLRAMGFRSAAAGPFVRSSYNAEEALGELRAARGA